MATTITIGAYSAYAIAVKYGYTGTEEEWIKSVETARKSAETYAGAADQALETIRTLQAEWLLAAHPVGSLYPSNDLTSPAELFGGTWEKIAEDQALMGASSSHPAGSTAEAGLPNVTGTFLSRPHTSGNNGTANTTYGGAIIWADNKLFTLKKGGGPASFGKDTGVAESGNHGYGDMVTVDASKSNSIYGKSSTVQPPAYYTNVWRRLE